MNFKNKTLALVVLLAIVISIFGAAYSIAKFERLFSLEELSLTGYAFSNQSGNVSISIEEFISISIVSGSNMDFGICVPFVDVNATINSENTKNTSRCSHNATIAPMSIMNDGSVLVNVTMNTSDIGTNYSGGTFIGSASNSNIAYKVPPTANCTGNQPTNVYHDLDNKTGYQFPICDALSVASSLNFHIEIILPPDVLTGSSATNITFIGCKSGGAC